jgi:hypothetical protein
MRILDSYSLRSIDSRIIDFYLLSSYSKEYAI